MIYFWFIKPTTGLKMLTPIQDLNSRKPPHVSNISKKSGGSSPSSNSSSETNSSSA